jgi:hypothetical protein
MDCARRALVVGLYIFGFVVLVGGQAPPVLTPPAPSLSVEETEAFLLKANIVSKKVSKSGVTGAIEATLSDGRLTHQAQIQNVDIQKALFQAGKASEVNFKDTYRFNIGGYRLARLLGLNVPMSVKRIVDGKPAAMTWWIDDVQFTEGGRLKQKNILGPDPERTSKQMYVMQVFDELIQNRDRNLGNVIWTKDWTLWMIDHTRAFRTGKELIKPDQLVRCERSLLEGMRALTMQRLQEVMGDIMQEDELQAVLARRDLLVKHFEDRIAARGEASVLFSM